MIPLKVTIHHKAQSLIREVNKELFTVGRSLDCDIHLNDNSISRVHVVVSVRGNKIFIEDKNSSNGTFVNGEEINKCVPVPVGPKDQIQLGTSEYVLIVSSLHQEEEAEVEEDDDDEDEDEESQVEDAREYTKDMPLPPAQEPAPTPSAKPSFLAEKALHDAKKRAAQIVMESEAQAERKVQAIFENARKTQEKAEEFYEKRVAEAHKEADAILSDFQKQGQELLKEARTLSESLREDVDGYIQSLKKKARIEADEIIAEANKQADTLKAEAVEQGHEKARKDSDSLISVAREEAAKIMEKAQKQAHELQESAQTELTQIQEKLKTDAGELEKLTVELEEAQKNLTVHRKDLEEITKKEAELVQTVAKEEAALGELRTSQATLATQKKTADEALGVLIDKQAKLTLLVQDLETKKAQLAKEAETQKMVLAEKFEKEKLQMVKMEEQRSEEIRLEFAKKIQKMEQDLVDDVIRRKTSLVIEIHSAVEKEVVQLVDAAKWRKISGTVQERINDAFDGKVASISQSSASAEQPVDLLKKRSNENLRWAVGGLLAGLLAFFVAQNVLDRVRRDQTPMQTRVKNEARQRQDELEKRRFNPTQTEGLKENYVDSVIYTRQFVEIYLDQDYQQRLYRATAQYLLKTWRLDEDKSLQVLAAANALVKELIDKKSKIHPDFVKEGLEKMHALETETLARMKEILGSEVRLESFLRFEREFFHEEVQRRRVAQH